MTKAPSWTVAIVLSLWVFGATMALGEVYLARAEASPATVNLSDIDIDQFPECIEEDCSDQPGQVGVWLDEDTGNWWLSLGEKSYLVVDDTVTA